MSGYLCVNVAVTERADADTKALFGTYAAQELLRLVPRSGFDPSSGRLTVTFPSPDSCLAEWRVFEQHPEPVSGQAALDSNPQPKP